MIQPLSPPKLQEYLDYACRTDQLPENYGYQGSSEPYAKAMARYVTAIRPMILELITSLPQEIVIETLICSLWLTGFSMGREFESREKDLETLAAMDAK